MSDPSPEFRRGYEYARGLYDKLLSGHSVAEILDLARYFDEEHDPDDEAARGMAAYCRELARLREKPEP